MAGLVPDVSDVHVNGLLTDISLAFMNEPNAYVADKIFPLVGVAKQSDIIPKYTAAYWLRNEMGERAPGTESKEAGWAVDNDNTYFAKGYGLRKIIPDEVRANTDAPYDMDRDATTFLTDKAMMAREIAFAAATNAGSLWTTNTTVGVKWSDFANSDPLNDILTGNRTVQQLIGRKCNCLAMGQIVYDRLRIHPDLMELCKYVTAFNIPAETNMAKVFDAANVFVVRGIYESAVEGATSSVLPIWDDDALLCYVPANPSLFSPAAGYTFYWKPLTGGGPQYIRRFRVESKSSDVVEVRSYFHVKLTSADSGLRWADVVD